MSVLVLFALTSSIFAVLLPHETAKAELKDVKNDIDIDECRQKLLSD